MNKSIKVKMGLLITCIVLGFTACQEKKQTSNTTANTTLDKNTITTTVLEDTTDKESTIQLSAQEKKVYEAFHGVYEAEDATLNGNATTGNKKKGFSGTGYVDGISNDGDGCEFTVTVPTNGFYDLNFISASYGGHKENIVAVDNDKVGSCVVDKEKFTDSILKKVYLAKGEHRIGITKLWGWIYLDCLKMTPSTPTDQSIFQVSDQLINKNADDYVRRLMSFLKDSYGNYTLSGQYADKGRYSKEIFAITNATGGKLPAILGLDLIDYTPSRVENNASSNAVEYAIEYDKLGGIISLCWHWNSPSKYIKKSEAWWSGFYTKSTSIDLSAIMSGKDKEGYDLLISDIDAIAVQLKRLEDAGVPILWRPLHEASGGWFWWGAKGADAYKELWKLLYDRLTNYHKINNLIWVWNGQNKDWYPGDEYVDVIGEDIYPGEKVYTSQAAKFNEVLGYTDAKKIIALTENGCLFDPDLAYRDDARWAWFSTWSGEFVVNTFGALSEQYTEEDMIRKVYNHDKVLTLDELPDLKTYTSK